MINESYFYTENECYFMIHSPELRSSRPTILFVHGLGDSHIDYLPYLKSSLIEHYNILIPDLLGHGKSSASSDYCFEHQVQGIENHIIYLQKIKNVQLANFILVAHSMGGIHATLLCESAMKKSIKTLINVEGSITQFGSFIAEKLVQAVNEQRFSAWFDDFKQKKIYEGLAQQFIAVRPYYASLEFCHPETFLKNGTQMYQMGRELSGKYTHLIGKKYAELTIPRIYCYGDFICKETIEFLKEHQLKSCYFSCKNHFLLSECVDEFVIFIDRYIKEQVK